MPPLYPRGSIRKTVIRLSPQNKTLIVIVALLLTGGILGLWSKANKALSAEIPLRGGTLVEGMIGAPRFINPVLAASETDRALTTLVYSGLLKTDSVERYIPNLAEKWSVSEDGLIYTVHIKESARFHDKEPVTADDVLFTIQKIKDQTLRSPRRAGWEGVTVQKVSDLEVRFIIREPYSGFLENLTIGILPEHIWSPIESEEFPFSIYNTRAVGSGPYRVENSKRNDEGLYEEMVFSSFSDYILGEPYVSTIVAKFFADEERAVEAYKDGDIDSFAGLSPRSDLVSEANIVTFDMPRVFAVFFNQGNSSVLARKEVRRALSLAIDRNALVDTVLGGYGTPLYTPLPKNLSVFEPNAPKEPHKQAETILTDEGWRKNESTGIMELSSGGSMDELAFTISTGNARELQHVAEFLKREWENIGASVAIETHGISELQETVIRPRDYEALLFGQVVGQDLDLFAFWHSAERVDPGLNVALYANRRADALLEDIRETSDLEERKDDLKEFEAIVESDVPAVFLYGPELLYLAPKRLRGIDTKIASGPSERFESVHSWYLYTEHIWNFLNDTEH